MGFGLALGLAVLQLCERGVALRLRQLRLLLRAPHLLPRRLQHLR